VASVGRAYILLSCPVFCSLFLFSSSFQFIMGALRGMGTSFHFLAFFFFIKLPLHGLSSYATFWLLFRHIFFTKPQSGIESPLFGTLSIFPTRYTNHA